MLRKRITIKLTEQDENILKKYVKQGHKSARAINRARILLMANEGQKVKDMAQTLGVSQTTVYNVRKNYNRGEQSHILDCIKDKPRSGRPIKLDSQVEAKVSMIACSDPPAGHCI